MNPQVLAKETELRALRKDHGQLVRRIERLRTKADELGPDLEAQKVRIGEAFKELGDLITNPVAEEPLVVMSEAVNQ